MPPIVERCIYDYVVAAMDSFVLSFQPTADVVLFDFMLSWSWVVAVRHKFTNGNLSNKSKVEE